MNDRPVGDKWIAADHALSRQSEVTLTARWIVPIVSPPIHHGTITLRGAQRRDATILGVGTASGTNRIDLGDVAVLPGLINAHTHLEFSDTERPLGYAGIELADWIGETIACRTAQDPASVSAVIERGMRESAQSGVRALGEITTTPTTYGPMVRRVQHETGRHFDLTAFAETLGLSPQRADERLETARRLFENHDRVANVTAAVSPHAPYSTSIELIDKSVRMARRRNSTIAMHIAESPSERELLRAGTGPFADLLDRMGLSTAGLFPWPSGTPLIDLLQRLAAAPRVALIHGNDLTGSEMDSIAESSHISVVYCPRTHAYFQHRTHPVGDLRRRGIRVALGTDSRASNPDLALWREIQFLLNHRQDLPPAEILRMGTIAGAEILGHDDCGAMVPGSRPGLGLVSTTADSVEALYRDLAHEDYF